MSQARFQKQQREKARQDKARAKRDRKAARAEDAVVDSSEGAEPTSSGDHQEQNVLAELATLHDLFESGSVEFEQFEDRKRELLGRLDV